MKAFAPGLIALLLAGALVPALAQAPADAHDSHHASEPAVATPAQAAPDGSAAASALSEGEITRWDPRTLKLTLRHGELKNLGMPPMTMVFRVQDASVVGTLQPGDKVRFDAQRVNGVFHVTRLQAAP